MDRHKHRHGAILLVEVYDRITKTWHDMVLLGNEGILLMKPVRTSIIRI
jgi:hypothetical protein